MKVKMCLPKVMEVLQMNNLGYWEKIRKLKPINARCGKVPTKLIRKFIEEYGLEFNPFEIFRINHPDLEAPWVQWPTISMPERIAFMDIIQKNISESQMKDEIDQWGAKLAPKVKEMFDVWHANYTKSLKKGRLEIVDSVEKISKSIDEIVELRKDFELTFVEEHSKIATILRKLTKRQRHLLREVAWMELRVLDEYPFSNTVFPSKSLIR
ncbi:unnamed protein product, partial [Mesorhabditis belari]|uniref:Uncharacterized protein n=1 Tax=Mesorhabditis belari TaxID=2138241 RepID=A0AAF3JA67_9BILA